MIIPASSCDNMVILRGKVSLFNLKDGSELASCILNVKGKEYQLIFDRNIETTLSLNTTNIRVVGELKTDKYGDTYVFVQGYRLTTKEGKYIKNRPTWWDISWPEEWIA